MRWNYAWFQIETDKLIYIDCVVCWKYIYKFRLGIRKIEHLRLNLLEARTRKLTTDWSISCFTPRVEGLRPLAKTLRYSSKWQTESNLGLFELADAAT